MATALVISGMLPDSRDLASAEDSAPSTITYTVARTYPQDPDAFTQGLYFDGKTLFLGTGQHGQSSIRKVDLQTGKTTLRRNLDASLFGEGIAVSGNRLFQLTWQSKTGLIYEADTLKYLSSFSYPTEGWGLTFDGKSLIMSNGSAQLFFLSPSTLKRDGSITVKLGKKPVSLLNEMEFINGRIYANIWQSDQIVVINPQSGQVESLIDCSQLTRLMRKKKPDCDVLNGIAYDSKNKHLLVTGKYWTNIFALELSSEP